MTHCPTPCARHSSHGPSATTRSEIAFHGNRSYGPLMQATKRMAFVSLVALPFFSACADQSPVDGGGPIDGGGGSGNSCGPDWTCGEGLVCDRATNKCALPAGTYDDCRDLGRSCFDPYECIEYETGSYGCRFPGPRAVTCRGTPAGQVVPFVTTTGADDGLTLHWPLAGGCIPITYEEALRGWSPGLTDTATVWNDVGCARICFSPPVEAVTTFMPERGDRRIHVFLGSTGTWPAVTNVFFEEETGRMIGAEIVMDPTRIDGIEGRDILRLLGYALGLGTSSGLSVMAEDRKASTITTYDRDALCKLYGDAAYCGE